KDYSDVFFADYTVIDLETTGLSAKSCEIIELAAAASDSLLFLLWYTVYIIETAAASTAVPLIWFG
ncbi:MAG: hypothetical protein NC177_17440, partial [Ruminococcus flavefaciens]|nr:hypothetical protein [Ruminococcus flavefaciens]